MPGSLEKRSLSASVRFALNRSIPQFRLKKKISGTATLKRAMHSFDCPFTVFRVKLRSGMKNHQARVRIRWS